MPQHTHSHADGPEHEHEGATPGHSHDAAAAPAAATTAAVDVGPSAGGLSTRIILTLLGAAAMIVGSFLAWLAGGPEDLDTKGTVIPFDAFWSIEAGSSGEETTFFTSAGAIVILFGLLALLGLALRTGWLTRLAGALGIVAVVLIVITIYRADGDITNLGLGLWLILAGSVVVLIAGFLGSRRVVSATVPAAPAP